MTGETTPSTGAPTRVGVLALQGDVAEHLAALREAGAGAVSAVRGPGVLASLDGLVIPGGESTTIGRLMAERGLHREIQTRVAQGMGVFGTCAGLILLAEQVVGRGAPGLGLLPITVRRNAYGRQLDSFETHISAPSISPAALPAVFIRAPWIEALGPGVEVLASHDGRCVLCRLGRVLGASFHPELTGDRRLHRYFLSLLGPDAR